LSARLVDLIRSGKAPETIRRKGATGNLPIPAEEKIEVLAFLATAGDQDLSAQAFQTLQAWDRAEVRRIMASPQTAPEVLRFGVEHLAAVHEDLRDVLLWNPSLPAESRNLLHNAILADPAEVKVVGEYASGPSSAALEELPANPDSALAPIPDSLPALEGQPGQEGQPQPVPHTEEAAIEILAKLAAGAKIEDLTVAAVEIPPEVTMRDDELTQKHRETLIEKVSRMTVVEKIKAAVTGNMETRALLIRDSNKIISRAVLQSPKISETEAENYAAAKNVSDEVLRLIAQNRKFIKSYTVLRALVNNPRAPIDVTMPLIIRINERDLKGLTLNRNVPDVIRSLANKMIKQREDAGKVKLFNRH